METWKAPYFSAKVPDDFAGTERLDKYISALPNGLGRSKLKSGLQQILVNGNAAKLSSKIRAGDQIDVYWEDSVPDNIEPENIPLKIVYEDNDVCVVNKTQGMVTHPAAGNWSGTLVNALLHHWGRAALPQIAEGEDGVGAAEILERRRPGIVHRLDKDTSGLIITAKNRGAEEWLQAQFQSRRLVKEYILIVKGCPPKKDGVVDTYITRDPADRKRFKAVAFDGGTPGGGRKHERFGEDVEKAMLKAKVHEEGASEIIEGGSPAMGKRAVTLYHVASVYGGYSLVRVRILTGRTHQIRVHMKFLGCPVLGDAVYSKKDALFPNAALMLHSRLLQIRLPGRDKITAFKAAVPERFKQTIRALKATQPRSYASPAIKAAESARVQDKQALQNHNALQGQNAAAARFGCDQKALQDHNGGGQ